ncbi:MAG: DNA-binding IclR family transcriptional regulator [Afipia broomeae]|jgi:DNA-binding IclR family transcriptional regulator
MAEISKLSVEKALKKIRTADKPKTRTERHSEDMEELDKEIKRMRAQRLRLDRQKRD